MSITYGKEMMSIVKQKVLHDLFCDDTLEKEALEWDTTLSSILVKHILFLYGSKCHESDHIIHGYPSHMYHLSQNLHDM
jgi:hypothetical protein